MTELYESKRLAILQDRLYQRAMTGRIPAALEGVPEGQEDATPSPLTPEASLQAPTPRQRPGDAPTAPQRPPSAVRALAERYGPQYGVDPLMVQAVIQTESAGNPYAVSKAGAQGLMQLMPETGRRFGVQNPFDPDENVRAGTRYLGFLLQRYGGDTSRALAAYNAGEGNVDQYGGIPPFPETKRYVPLVLKRHQRLQLDEGLRAALTAPTPRMPDQGILDRFLENPEQFLTQPDAPAQRTFDTTGRGRAYAPFTPQEGVEEGGGRLLGGALTGAINGIRLFARSLTTLSESVQGRNQPGVLAGLATVGQDISRLLAPVAQATKPTIIDQTFLDRFATVVGQATPALVVGALSGGGAVGATATAFIEAAQEAQSVKEQLVPLLGDEEANRRAMKSFGVNLALIGLTDRFGIFGSRASQVRYAVRTVAMNDLQEVVQYEIERSQLTVPASHPQAQVLQLQGWERQGDFVVKAFQPADLGEVLVMATMMGGLMTGAGLAMVRAAEQQIPAVQQVVEQERTAVAPQIPETLVQDAGGKPLRVYHGTPLAFGAFDPGRMNPDALYGPGIYFTDSPLVAGGTETNELSLGYATAEGRNTPLRELQMAQRELGILQQRLSPEEQQFQAQALASQGRDYVPMNVDTRAQLMAEVQDHVARIAELTRQQTAAPNVRPAYLNITQPFDIDAPVTAEHLAAIEAALDETVQATFFTDLRSRMTSATPKGWEVYVSLEEALGRDRGAVNAALHAAGHDGITHIGGANTGTDPHRVYIAFSPDQVIPAFSIDAALQAAQQPGTPPPDVPLPTWQRWAQAVLNLLPEASTAPGPRGILTSQRGAVPLPGTPVPPAAGTAPSSATPGAPVPATTPATSAEAMASGIAQIQQHAQAQPQLGLLQQPSLTQAFGALQQFASEYASLRETQTRGERPRLQAQQEGTQLALLSGLDVTDLAGLLPGTTMTDAEVAALAQRGGAQYAVTRDSAQTAIASQDDADIATALGDFFALGRYFLLPMEGVRAESGRTLGILNDPIASLNAMLRQVQTVLDEARSAPVTTEHDAALAILHSFTALGTPQQQIAHATKVAQAAEGGVLGKIFWEIVYFDLLINPATHAANILGSVTSAMMRIPLQLVAGEVGRVHRGINWMRDEEGETAYTGEALQSIVGLVNGLTLGVRAVGRHLRAQDLTVDQLTDAAINMQLPDLMGISPHDPFRRALAALQAGRVTSSGGKANLSRGLTSDNLGIDPASALGHGVDYLGDLLRTPGDALGAGDALTQSTMQWMQLHALAYRRAKASGLKGQDFWTHYATTIQQRPASVVEEMERLSVWDTLNTELGPAGQFFQKGIEAAPILRLLVPFFRIGVNTTKWANEYIFPSNLVSLGLHWMTGASNNLLREFEAGGATRDTAIAKVALSVGMQAVMGSLVAAGLVTGAGPQDPRAKKNWIDAGYQPFSVWSGTQPNGRPLYTGYGRLEPSAMTLGTLATIHEILAQVPTQDAQVLAGAFLLAYKETLVSKTWMKSMHELTSDLFTRTDNPEEALDPLAKTFRSVLTGPFLPAGTFLNALRRETDPIKRSVFTLLDAYMNKIPGYSQELEPDLDFLGHPRFYPAGVGSDMVSPLYTTRVKDVAVFDELRRIAQTTGHGFADMPRVWVEGQSNTKIKLTSQEYYAMRLFEMQTPLAQILATVGLPEGKAQRQAEQITKALKLAPERAQGLTGEELLTILVTSDAHKALQPLPRYLAFQDMLTTLRQTAKDALKADLWRKYPSGLYPDGTYHAAALSRNIELQEAQALGATPTDVEKIRQGHERALQGLRIAP